LIDGTLKAIIETQTVLPDEIVVVNGGGENDCSSTLDFWKEKFPELREIKTKNVNLATSRNIGLPQCKGELIIQTDDDAEPFPNWIEKLIEAHQKHPEAGVIGGDVVDASGKGLLFKIADATTFPHYDTMREVRNVPGVNSSYKRAVIEQVGDYDTTLFRGEDVDYNWRAIQAGWKVLYFPEIKVYHHHRASWKGLFNQHYMYGRAYYLVRRKWTNMYCSYPQQLSDLKSVLKSVHYLVNPFLDAWGKASSVKGLANKVAAYPIIIAIQYYWKLGVFHQLQIEKKSK
jgi:GT2 family glycosyltransferase